MDAEGPTTTLRHNLLLTNLPEREYDKTIFIGGLMTEARHIVAKMTDAKRPYYVGIEITDPITGRRRIRIEQAPVTTDQFAVFITREEARIFALANPDSDTLLRCELVKITSPDEAHDPATTTFVIIT